MTDPLFISDTTECRRLARNVVVGDFSDAQIIVLQKASYAEIIISTNKSDWTNTDPRFPALQWVETQKTAAKILEHYGAGSPEELNWITFWTTSATTQLTEIKENTTDPEADEPIIATSSDYVSYGALYNEDPATATIYRSTDAFV